MILEVDIGNTRLKWRLRSREALAAIAEGVLDNKDIDKLADKVTEQGTPQRVAVACVGKPEMLGSLRDLSESWGASLSIATTRRSQCGVECGYRNPAQMGVDRWLAVIAAFNEYRQACVVIDAGSAITVDLVDDKGLHRGGYIVPGFHKMLDCLYRETSRVKVSELLAGDLDSARLKPGVSTEEAVSRGLYSMVEGMVKRAIGLLEEEGISPTVVITGGDAALVAELGICGQIRDNLVLDGLSIVLGEGG